MLFSRLITCSVISILFGIGWSSPLHAQWRLQRKSEPGIPAAGTDLVLGSIGFRGETEGGLRPIRASHLFERLGQLPVEGDDVAAISDQLNQIFILKTIANVLDTEAEMSGSSFKVPESRVEYAVRKILYIDSRRYNGGVAVKEPTAEEYQGFRDQIFEEFLHSLINRFENQGTQGEQILAKMGITQDLIQYLRLSTFERKEEHKVWFQQWRAFFEYHMKRYLISGGSLRPPAPYSFIAYDELPHEYFGYFTNNLLMPRDEVYFARLKSKIGKGPFHFMVRWNAMSAIDQSSMEEESLKRLLRTFNEPWPTVVIQGGMGKGSLNVESSEHVSPDTTVVYFPETLKELKELIQKSLLPIQRFRVRMLTANQMMLKYGKNLDLASREKAERGQIELNPLSPAYMPTTQEMTAIYEKYKSQIALRQKRELFITEIQLGNVSGKVQKPGRLLNNSVTDDEGDNAVFSADQSVAGCATKFKSHFEPKFFVSLKYEQESIFDALRQKKMSRQGREERLNNLRRTLPGQIFHTTMNEIQSECPQFSAKMIEKSILFDPFEMSKLNSEDELRVRFFSSPMTKLSMIEQPIPYFSWVDDQGNVHHSFFRAESSSLGVTLPLSDPMVNAMVRKIAISKRLASRMMMALSHLFRTRYSIFAYKSTFDYAGVSGFQLDDAVSDPEKWLSAIFETGSVDVLKEAYMMP